MQKLYDEILALKNTDQWGEWSKENIFFLPLVLHVNKLIIDFNPLSANLTKWSNTLKQFVDAWPLCRVGA